jgi:hypothetical protein
MVAAAAYYIAMSKKTSFINIVVLFLFEKANY